MDNVEIRPITQADIIEMNGQPLRHTVQGWSIYKDNELAAICGVTFGRGVMIVFSDIKPDVVAPKVTIWRTALKLLDKIRGLNISTVYAVASPKWPGAPAFLERLGFEHVESSVRGEIFRWRIQEQ